MNDLATARKPFLLSKTIWISILGLAASIFALVAGEEWIQAYPAIVALLLMGREVLNVILRFVTTGPITGLGNKKT